MQKYVILFIFTIFFAGLTYFLLQTLNPFDLEKVNELVVSEEIIVIEEFAVVIEELIGRGLIFQLLNTRNVALIGTVLSISLTSGFMFIHLLLDKILTRKFYEEPNVLMALRRGIFFSAGLVSILVFRIFHADDTLSILTIGLLVVVEIALVRIFSALKLHKISEGSEEDSEKEEEPKKEKKEPRFQMKKLLQRFPKRNKDLQEPSSTDIIGDE